MNRPGDFERDLERELHRVLDPIAAVPIPPLRARASRGIARRMLGGAGAALGVKVVTGLAIAAFAAAAAGAVTEIAFTGSLNPTDWGQRVHDQYAQPASDNHQSTSNGSQDNAKETGVTGGKGGGNTGGSGKGNSTSTGAGSGTGTIPSPGKKHPGPTPVPVGPPLP